MKLGHFLWLAFLPLRIWNPQKPTDEGMTCGSLIFAYLVFGPRRASTEGTTRPTKIIAWHGPGANLTYKAKIRGDQVGIGFS
jgi:hypothetical protein